MATTAPALSIKHSMSARNSKTLARRPQDSHSSVRMDSSSISGPVTTMDSKEGTGSLRDSR
jgi:hypothetical protein